MARSRWRELPAVRYECVQSSVSSTSAALGYLLSPGRPAPLNRPPRLLPRSGPRFAGGRPSLLPPTNATLADASGAATITNDDTAAGPATITVPIAVAGDDVNQEGTSLSAASSTVWLGTGAPSVTALTGLRFAGVGIPRNATITAARLEVQAASTQWLSIGFELGAEAAGSSLPFSTAAPPSGRVLLTPRVAHSSNTQWVAGTWYSFADLTPLLQALVTRADWDAGNALSLILRGTGSAYGRKFARSFEAGAATAPRLVISYVVP